MKTLAVAGSAWAGAVVALIGLFAQAAEAQVVPTINVQETCRAAAGVMANLLSGSTVTNDVQICVDSENKARDQIAKDWNSYTAADRAGCVQASGYLPSYVEWLTCFEMNKSVREANQQGRSMGALTNPDGSMTLPPLRTLGIMASSYANSWRRR